MISAENISLSFGSRFLFKEVNLKFTPGNCYGIIGANGSGKSTFLRILSGELEPDTGTVVVTPGERVAVLRRARLYAAAGAFIPVDAARSGRRRRREVK